MTICVRRQKRSKPPLSEPRAELCQYLLQTGHHLSLHVENTSMTVDEEESWTRCGATLWHFGGD